MGMMRLKIGQMVCRSSYEVHAVYDKEIGISRRSSSHHDSRNQPYLEEPSKGCIEGLVTSKER
jgi:hypothetical protein